MKKISPSILSADFTKLAEEIRVVEAAGADYLHIDVMDGRFVPNITIGPFVVEAIESMSSIPLDVHLMIDAPERYVADFAKAGSDIITVHAEASVHLHRTIQQIKELGKRAGVSINPSTPVEFLDHILGDIDLVLVMSVNPGFSGQGFIESALKKIEIIRGMLDRGNHEAELEVDGGVKVSNIGAASRAGADVFVSGSGVFGSGNYKATIEAMRKEIG